jgi:hypothetical protein
MNIMRKFTLLTFFLCLFGIISQAQTLNNPKDAKGYYIVKWNCTTDTWAASNDIEVDQTFVFAVDVTGTPFEAWLKATPTNTGATRALAINKWTNYGDVSGGTNRLKQIKGNIYAATWNIAQMAAANFKLTSATGIDSIVYVNGQVFGYEFTATNPGAGWWLWPAEVPVATAIDPGTGSIFTTLPYTGKKTSPEFFSDDVPGGLFFSNNTPEKGYTLPCAIPTGISEQLKAEVPIVDHEYYNLQGVKLTKAPQQGLYIHKAIKADGSSTSTKEVKSLK